MSEFSDGGGDSTRAFLSDDASTSIDAVRERLVWMALRAHGDGLQLLRPIVPLGEEGGAAASRSGSGAMAPGTCHDDRGAGGDEKQRESGSGSAARGDCHLSCPGDAIDSIHRALEDVSSSCPLIENQAIDRAPSSWEAWIEAAEL